MGVLLHAKINAMYTKEEQAKNHSTFYLSLAQFVPSSIIVGQGASFVWHIRGQVRYREKWLEKEKVERIVNNLDIN